MDLLNGIQAVAEATSQVTRTVADHLVQALAAEGVRHTFGYPGGAALPVYHALARHAAMAGGEGIEHLLVRHEQSAVQRPTAMCGPAARWACASCRPAPA